MYTYINSSMICFSCISRKQSSIYGRCFKMAPGLLRTTVAILDCIPHTDSPPTVSHLILTVRPYLHGLVKRMKTHQILFRVISWIHVLYTFFPINVFLQDTLILKVIPSNIIYYCKKKYIYIFVHRHLALFLIVLMLSTHRPWSIYTHWEISLD